MGLTKTKRRPQLIVRSLSKSSPAGRLTLGPLNVLCALGRSGKTVRKREGDGATPIGLFKLRCAFYRPDQGLRPQTALPLKRLSQSDGWCDDPGHNRYNRFVRHPFAASAERLWRDDHLYDVVIVIGHNDRPRLRSGGSAIFLHIAREGYLPTQGCVAVRAGDMRKLLALLRPSTKIRICG